VGVVNINNAPAGSAKTVTTPESTAYTFTTSDFGFTDLQDTPANSLAAVKIATLPSRGTLTNDGLAVAVGTSVTAGAIAAGKLVFTPTPGVTGTSTLMFQVQDDGASPTAAPILILHRGR